MLVYVTGGLAYGRVSHQYNYDTANISDANQIFASSNTAVGWTMGGGAEYALGRNWSVKAEYLYVGLGTANFNLSLVNVDHINGGNLSSTAVVTSARFNENIVRGGLNYHF